MRREPARDPKQDTIAGPLMCLQEKRSHVHRRPIFHSKSSEEQKKVITSVDVLFSTENLVKSKKKRKSSSSCDGAQFGQTGRTPENMTGTATLYSPAPSLNTTCYKTVIDTGTSFLVGLN